MRIIGGKYRGRRFTPPADKWPTRPTTDFAKEGLFNILHNRFDLAEVKMLDIFGGTGSHSYEAISRGCCDVTYVDQHRPCIKFVEKTAQVLDIEQYLAIHLMNASTFLDTSGDSFDYIFAGPPYRLEWLHQIPDRIFAANLLREDGLLVLEHDQAHSFEQHRHFEQIRKYGGSLFSFFAVNQSIDE